jgi:hypothetical protein
VFAKVVLLANKRVERKEERRVKNTFPIRLIYVLKVTCPAPRIIPIGRYFEKEESIG